MFDGTLGKYTGSNYTTELKEDAKPYRIRVFKIINQIPRPSVFV